MCACRRVICQPYVGLKENLLEGTKFRQMAGRAGRAGLDTHGEAILLASQGFPVSKLQLLLQVCAHEAHPSPCSTCPFAHHFGLRSVLSASNMVLQSI